MSGWRRTGGRHVTGYGRLAPVYDAMTWAYSLGAQQRAAAAWAGGFRRGDRVLYAGAGSGAGAMPAARRGVAITLLDRSEAMCARARSRLGRGGLDARVVCADLFAYRPEAPFDAVVSNFFLTVFPSEDVTPALTALTALARPGGEVLIADYAPPSARRRSRLLRWSYHKLANVPLWLAGAADLHPIHDYEPLLAPCGLRLEERLEHPVWPGGPVLYRGWRTRRRT